MRHRTTRRHGNDRHGHRVVTLPTRDAVSFFDWSEALYCKITTCGFEFPCVIRYSTILLFVDGGKISLLNGLKNTLVSSTVH